MEGSRRPVACRIYAYALAAPPAGMGLTCGSPSLGEPAIRGDEPLQHGHDEPDGIGDGLAGFTGQHLGIVDQIAVEPLRAALT